jgi:ABC-type polar amino acid transport system ATPase subunit
MPAVAASPTLFTRVAAIEFEAVHKHFGPLHVLNGIDLTVAEGEVVVIIGPSGSGKSTLIRTVNRLEPIERGRLVVNGIAVHERGVDVNALRRQVGMVFQSFNLFPHLTAAENVMLAPLRVRRLSQADARTRALALLAKVGIPEKADVYPAQLSGGQQQRVAIARALAMEPKIMLFDEPTSALDAEMIREVLDVMRELAREGMTMLVVTHEVGFAREASHRVVFMDAGRIIEDSPTSEFFGGAREERARQFLAKVIHH